MKTVINLVCIKNNKILLLLKRDVWILLGGKPNHNESNFDCLKREASEELPNTIITTSKHFGDFDGLTPHSHVSIRAVVFIGTVDGDITPSAEISDAKFFTKEELRGIPISDITSEIILDLIKKGYF